LKIGDFEAGYKSQMELYLRWLAKYEQEEDEAPPLGIILCTGNTQEHIELLELNISGPWFRSATSAINFALNHVYFRMLGWLGLLNLYSKFKTGIKFL